MPTSSRRSLSKYATRTSVSGSSAPTKRDRWRRAPLATPRFLPRSRVRKTTMRSASPSLYVRSTSASAVYSGTNPSILLSFSPLDSDQIPRKHRRQAQEREESDHIRHRRNEHGRRQRGID